MPHNTIYEPKNNEGSPLKEIVEEIFMIELAPKVKAMIDEAVRKTKEELRELIDPAKIARKLESLRDNDRLDADAIKNLAAFVQIYANLSHSARPGGGGGDTVRYTDLSSQLDGSTKTFTLTRVARILMVIGTQAPLGYRPATDWTFAQSTGILTLTATVSAPTTGQTLIVLYVES